MSHVDRKDNELKKLEDDNMDKVSGGYMDDSYLYAGSERRLKNACDNCGRVGAFPTATGHLCESCLKKLVNIIGKENAGSIFKVPMTSENFHS